MDKTAENEYRVTVNNSIFHTKLKGTHVVILFIACFAAQFLIYAVTQRIFNVQNYYVEEYLPEAAFIIALLVVCIYYYIVDRRTNGVMQMTIHFLDTSMEICIKGKKSIVKYNDIVEVSKIMVIDRIHTEKGCYRMKIKCHGRTSLEFETTEQEYDKHLDFEETELYVFYNACRKNGLKCC